MSAEPSKLWTIDEVRAVMEYALPAWREHHTRVLDLMRMIEGHRERAAEEERRAVLVERAKTQPRDERGHFTKRDLSAA